ncbi:MAG: FAD-dependent oxidoreductase, partial [Anaerolineaceae bacterium]|nr:FAD-dependent oxidoreductase [Anaerolineaceae bacterium]
MTSDSEPIAGRQGQVYDCIIVGGGPTGLAAAIYSTREQLKTVIIEKMIPGGQILTTAQVENYPGFPDPISGWELTERLVTQAKRFGAEIRERTEVT